MSGWLAMLALAALTSGLMGGLHCGAMCGAMTGLAHGKPARGLPVLILAAHGGRVSSYAVAGALAGAMGQGGLALRGTVAAQQAVMLAGGVALILAAASLMRTGALARWLEAMGAVLWRLLSPALKHVMPADTPGRALAMGVMWGWLPCGMVYAALILALSAGDPVSGAVVMLAFGAGTLPALMIAQGAVRRLALAPHSHALRATTAAVLAGAGAWTVARGLFPALPDDVGGLICRVAGISP